MAKCSDISKTFSKVGPYKLYSNTDSGYTYFFSGFLLLVRLSWLNNVALSRIVSLLKNNSLLHDKFMFILHFLLFFSFPLSLFLLLYFFTTSENTTIDSLSWKENIINGFYLIDCLNKTVNLKITIPSLTMFFRPLLLPRFHI